MLLSYVQEMSCDSDPEQETSSRRMGTIPWPKYAVYRGVASDKERYVIEFYWTFGCGSKPELEYPSCRHIILASS